MTNPKGNVKRVRYLSDEEEKRLLAHLPDKSDIQAYGRKC
tara:strand:+ start:554 stop:673 length:120 start_codon:yes stop_codon:yes gene_type:complete